MTARCHTRDHQSYTAAAASETRRMAEVIRGADLSVSVPSCPDWTLAALVEHVGSVHRWAAQHVRELAQERIPGSQVEVGLPDDPAGYADWLAAGATVLETSFGPADPDAPVWGWGSDHHVRFWPRRMLHETTVHRVDAELALGRTPEVDAGAAVDGPVAVDGIDEFLDNLPHAASFAPGVKELRGTGEVLRFGAVDAGVDWFVRLDPGGFTWAHDGDAAPSAAVEAAAGDVLLLMYGRGAPDSDGVTVSGDRAVLDHWLGHAAI